VEDKYGHHPWSIKKLGASCDWDRTALQWIHCQAVIDTTKSSCIKGLIYRGVRMVNWDPKV
jgi:valyl-tRNA synthetase